MGMRGREGDMLYKPRLKSSENGAKKTKNIYYVLNGIYTICTYKGRLSDHIKM
jgi:hypothetical protein